FMCCLPLSRRVPFEIGFQVGEGCNLTAHGLCNHRPHQPGEAPWLKVQGKGDTRRVSERLEPEGTRRPGWPGGGLEGDDLARPAFDDLVVAGNATAARTLQGLFVSRPYPRWAAGDMLNIYHRGTPEGVIRTIEDECEHRGGWPTDGDALFCV